MKSGEEPYVFTTHFHGWDFTKRKSPPTFDKGLEAVAGVLAQYSRKYTYPIDSYGGPLTICQGPTYLYSPAWIGLNSHFGSLAQDLSPTALQRSCLFLIVESIPFLRRRCPHRKWPLRLNTRPRKLISRHESERNNRRPVLILYKFIYFVRHLLCALFLIRFIYRELVEKQYPKGLDGSILEKYLEDDEFMKVFEMTSDEFAKLPLWKRQKMKKEMGLY